MADIPASARGSANGTGTKNVQVKPVSVSLPSRIVCALQYDPAKTLVVEDVLTLILGAADAANRFGFGSQMHRAVLKIEEATEGIIPVYGIPIPIPTAGPVSATGTITIGAAATSSGTLTFYIAGTKFTVSVTDLDTETVIGDAIAAAINTDNPSLPVTAVNVAGVVTLTSKWDDTTANDITIKYNLLEAEQDLAPTGATVAIVAMASGAGISDITAALLAITSSSIWFTDLITPYNSETELDEVLAAIGNPDSYTGLYGKLDYRPLTNWTGNVAAEAAGLTAAIALGDSRKTDAVNDYVNAPDYIEPPFEIAAYVAGLVALRADQNAASHYEGISASGLFGPEVIADDWTTSYTSRDLAVKAGLSVVYIKNGVVVLGDIASFYHPDGVANPAFLFEVNKRKTWNVANDVKADKNDPARQGSVLVEDSTAATDQSKATDTILEVARIVSLSDQWSAKGLLYSATFTKKNTTATINVSNPDRIDRNIPILLSGNTRIRNDEISIDRNTTIVNISITS